MFLPKYSITNRILSNIVKIELDLCYLKSVDIPIEWTKRLKTEALLKRLTGELRMLDMHINTEIISKVVVDDPERDEKILDIASRLDLNVKERDLQMVLNLIKTNKLVDQISYISNKFSQERILLKEMFQINKLVGERMVSMEHFGGLRNSEVRNSFSLSLHPLANEVQYQIDEFMSWFENSDNNQIHPIVKFSVSLGELLRIVPFESYSTLTSFFFSLAFLGSVGYGFSYFALEEEIVKTQDKLEKAIVDYEKEGWDLTGLIDYFVGVLQVSASKAKIRVANIEGVSVKYRGGSGRAVALSERQLTIMEEITTLNEMTIKQIREVLPLVSDDTILRDIKDLVNKKMIRKRGKTKGAIYVLGKVKSFG